jgi:tRNA pseudouridine55 synthase
MDGLILVHKPAQMTSHDVVAWIRKTLRFKKVGHFGTLDPWATGLLIIALGKATRLFSLFLHAPKFYHAHIKLGTATDTYDFLGRPLSPEVKDFPDKKSVKSAMKNFTGEILQVPPIYSAKKHRGRPLYDFARRNQKIEPKANKVYVQTFELTNYEPPILECEVRCSSGTYIRSLAHDLGQKLGCGAHLVQLERTAIDAYRLEDSLSLNEIQEKVNSESLHDIVLPMESLLPQITKVVLSQTGSRLSRNGNLILPEHILSVVESTASKESFQIFQEELFRLFSSEGKLLAFARQDRKKNGLHPFLVIDSEKTKG